MSQHFACAQCSEVYDLDGLRTHPCPGEPQESALGETESLWERIRHDG